MATIQDKLTAAQNRPSGFDYLRIILSTGVIAWHAISVSYGRAAETPFWTGPLRPLVYLIVPSFFALSGFLVAGSLDRNNLPAFLTLRGIRIFPALAVEVFISALLIGPIFTTLSLGDYFTSPMLAQYFGNVLGNIHFYLPGVFADLPAGPLVNVQLWTVPYELECYITISLLALIGLHRRPGLLLTVVMLACFAFFGKEMFTGVFPPYDGRPAGRMVVLCFLFGVGIYALRGRIPCNWPLFAVSLALTWVLLSLKQTLFLAPLPVAYMTVFLGLLNPARTAVLRGADYSYGLYLYGFPVQQTISALFPQYRFWWFNFVGSMLVTSVLAFMSWHLLEARVLGRRREALAFVVKLTQRTAGVWARILSVRHST